MAAVHNPAGRPTKNIRQQAEQLVPKTPTDVSGMSADEIAGLLHELEVHQEEFKIQNEELRRLQFELESSRECLADLYDFAPAGYVTVDANGVIVQANLATATMLGLDRSKIVGTRLAMYCEAGSRIDLCEHLGALLTSKTSQSCELKFTTPAGAMVDVRLHSNHLAASGTGVDWQCRMIMTDITSDKAAESKLRESESFFRTIFEQAAVGVGQLNSVSGVILKVNRRYCEMLQMTAEDLLGRTWMELTHPDDLADDLGYMERLRAGEIREFSIEKRMERPDGSFVWINLTVSPMWRPGEEPSTHIAVVEDISGRKEAEAEVRLRDHAFNSSSNGILIVDAVQDDMPIIYANPAFEAMTGYSAGEVLGRNCRFLQGKDVDQPGLVAIRKALQRGLEVTTTLRNYRKDGTMFWCELHISPVRDANGRLIQFLGFQNDVTARKEVEAEHARLLDILQRSLNEIYVFDSESLRFEYVNASAMQNLGYSLDAMHRMKPSDIKPEYTETAFRDIIAPLQSGKQELLCFETLHQRADGSRYPVEVHLQLIRRENDEVFLSVILDITERKAQEQKYREIVETTQEWIWEIDLQGVQTFSNPAMLTLLGYSADDLVDGNALDLMHEEDREVVERELPRRIAQREGWTGWVVRWRHKDGSIRYLESNANPVMNENGELTGLRGTDRDVSDRVRSNEQLRVSEERYRVLTENATEAIVVMDVDTGRFVDFNQKACDLYKVSAEQLRQMGPADTSPALQPSGESSESLVRLHIRQALGAEGVVHAFEWTHVNSAGELIPCDVRIVRIPDPSRRLLRGAVTDITERKNTELSLRESEEKFRALTERSPAIVLIARLDQILYCNSMLSEVTGYSHEELLRTPLREIIHPDFREPIADRQRRRLKGEAVPQRYDGKIVTKSGEERWLDVSVQLIEFEGAPAALVTCVNVTERKLAEAALRQSEETLREVNASLEHRVAERTIELTEANAELTAFAHTVSHDLRAPLRAMEGFATALAEDYGERLDEDARDFIQHIIDSAKRMDALVHDLLVFSRLGRKELNLKAIRLDSIVTEARRQLNSEFEACQARLEVADQMPAILGHKATLVQVVANLLSNAIKFVAEGVRPEIRAWAERRDDGMIRLWIEDNGIGIDQAYRDRVFHVFERLHGIESYPGTGIGLAIVARACERLGGRCGFESHRDQGSRFWVEFQAGDTIP